MNLQFREVPQQFGVFHLLMLAGIAAGLVFFTLAVRKKNEVFHLTLLHRMGLFMLLTEVWKQWFTLRYVFGGVYNMWFFPWQLCSMAMYLSFVLPYLKETWQNTALVFLGTFSFFAALVALAVPSDMLRPQVFLCLHGFLYHALMLAEAVLAILILRHRSRVRFLPAAGCFLAMSAVAEGINVFAHVFLPDRWPEPNMFYITPYYPSTQVICSYVADQLGILPEIFLYTAAILLFSGVFYLLEKVFLFREPHLK